MQILSRSARFAGRKNFRSYARIVDKTYLESLTDAAKTLERNFFAKKDVAYSYGWDFENNKSVFDPHNSLERIDFFRKNQKGEDVRTVLAFSGSAAAFDSNRIYDHGTQQDQGIGDKSPAQLAKEGIKEVAGFPKKLVYAMGGAGVHDYVQFIAANYGTFEQNRAKLKKTNNNPEIYYSYEALAFAEQMLPLFSPEYEIKSNGTISGKRMPLEDAIENINKVTMVAQSYGGAFVRQVTNVNKQHLRDLNYNEREIPQILNSFVFIGFGPVTNALHDNKCPLNSVYFANPNDARSAQHIHNFNDLVPEEIKNGYKLSIQGLNHNTTTVWSAPTNYSSFTFVKDCDGKKQEVCDPENHTLYFYLAFARMLENGEIPDSHIPSATLMRSVLLNATQRNHSATMEELLTYNPKILENKVDATKHNKDLPTLQGTRSFAENEINRALERAKRDRNIEIGRV